MVFFDNNFLQISSDISQLESYYLEFSLWIYIMLFEQKTFVHRLLRQFTFPQN